MGVFKKQGVSWVDYYVNGHHNRERAGPNQPVAKTVLRRHHAEKWESPTLWGPLANQELDEAAGRLPIQILVDRKRREWRS